MLTTSALRRKAASSNEVRVRVLGSTKKLTSVLPRRAGTFLISRAPTCLNAAAVSRIERDLLRGQILDAERDPCASTVAVRWRITGLCHPDGIGDAVHVFQTARWTRSAARGGEIFADVIGADRQFAVAAVDEHGVLDARGAAEAGDGVHRRAAGAAGVGTSSTRMRVRSSMWSGRCETSTGERLAGWRSSRCMETSMTPNSSRVFSICSM